MQGAGVPILQMRKDTVYTNKAVEIAAMLGESVVGIKYVMNPRGGKITKLTYGLFAMGAALLLMAVVAFAVGVANVQHNAETKSEHLAAGKPLSEHRPHRISPAYDVMAFGGVVGGALCLILGLVRYRNEQNVPVYRIGRGEDVDFAIDGAPTESFPLVAPRGDDFAFNFVPGMDGELLVDGESIPLDALAEQGRAQPSQTVPGSFETIISDGARIRARVGLSTFFVSSVKRPHRYPVPFWATLDTAPLPYLAGSAAVLLAILCIAWWGRIGGDTLALDLIGDQKRVSAVESAAFEGSKREQQAAEGDVDGAGGSGAKRDRAEGKMGEKKSRKKRGRHAMARTSKTPKLARNRAVERATQSGFLGESSALRGGAFTAITSPASFSSGFDDRNVYGGMTGADVHTMYGSIFGAGVEGMGPGADGIGWGIIGAGDYRTIGPGGGTGSGYQSGPGGGDHLREHRASAPRVTMIAPPTIIGERDRSIIRRYIRTKRARLAYCYERQLMVEPDLRGTLVARFQISPMGTVLHASATGLGTRGVETCVAQVIKSIQFPRVPGGGVVNVRYPFTFQPTGR